MSRNVVYIGLAVVLAGVIAALYFYNLGQDELIRVKPEYEITAGELYYEFSENEETANEKYINKVIQVTGILEDKELTSEGNPNLVLKTSDASGSVICSFSDSDKQELDALKEGDEITIRGICAMKQMDVVLNNCVLIKP